MATLIIPRAVDIGGGSLITYKGTPNKCAYWEVVGMDGATETVSVGSLIEAITVNDANGFSVNRYIASVDPLDAGKVEKIKVTESA